MDTITAEKPNVWRRVNPLRVGFVIILGILTLYVSLLWQRQGHNEQELREAQAANAALKTEVEGLQMQLRSLERRVPIGEFTLHPPAPSQPAR